MSENSEIQEDEPITEHIGPNKKMGLSDRVRRVWSDIFNTAMYDKDVEGVGFQFGDTMSDTETYSSSLGYPDQNMYSHIDSSRDLPSRETEQHGSDSSILNRRQRYISFDNLEDLVPEVKVALDTYAEESVSFDPDGHCFQIMCGNNEVKKELEFLFFSPKMLNFDRELYPRVRNLCKYGDGFWEIVTDPTNPQFGVLQSAELDPMTMYRIQTRRGKLLEFQQTRGEPDYNIVKDDISGIHNKSENPNDSVFWSWRDSTDQSKRGQTLVRFAPAQVVHLRLGGGEKRQYGGYGTSVLDSARRAAYNLRLLEDSLLLYRLVRAPERRVYYVDLGQAAGNKVESFLKDFRNNVKRRKMVDEKTGQISEKYNPFTMEDDLFIPVRPGSTTRVETLPGACLALDTEIPLLDGRTVPLSMLIDEYDRGLKNWAYSCDPISGAIVPGEITWAGVTRKSTSVVRIAFDNCKSIIVTPDHNFPISGKGKVEAKDLGVGDNLVSFHSNDDQIYDASIGKWILANQVVSNFLHNIVNKKNHKRPLSLYKRGIEVVCNLFGIDKKSTPRNHKVVSVEILEDKIDTGTITVDGDEKLHNFHTFALSTGVFTYNSNLSDIEDAFYFRKKFYLALGVPPGYMDQTVESQTTRFMLSALNVRFATRVYRIQREPADAIREIGARHLTLLGVPGSIWEDLKIIMTPPSEWREVAQAEVMNNRANLALSIKNLNIVDDDWIRLNVLRLNDDENTDQRNRIANQQLEQAEVDAQKLLIQARAEVEVERGKSIASARLKAEMAAATSPDEALPQDAAPDAAPDSDMPPTDDELAAAAPGPEDDTIDPEQDINADASVDTEPDEPRNIRLSAADIEIEREGI